MIESEAERHAMPKLHFALPRGGLLLNAADSEDCDLWKVDNRRKRIYAERTQIGNGKGASGQVLGQALACDRSLVLSRNSMAMSAMGFL